MGALFLKTIHFTRPPEFRGRGGYSVVKSGACVGQRPSELSQYKENVEHRFQLCMHHHSSFYPTATMAKSRVIVTKYHEATNRRGFNIPE